VVGNLEKFCKILETKRALPGSSWALLGDSWDSRPWPSHRHLVLWPFGPLFLGFSALSANNPFRLFWSNKKNVLLSQSDKIYKGQRIARMPYILGQYIDFKRLLLIDMPSENIHHNL
jgi:hypothetical protein